jgi:pimeloyl-ACP methyl ester carboxylesterase
MTLPEITSPLAPPSRKLLLREVLVGLDLARGLLGGTRALPRGHGPVLVIPGFMASDLETFLLRRKLAALGYSVYGWGLGRNHGKTGKLLPPLVQQVQALQQRHALKVQIVGWSLGGVLARDVAREAKNAVAQVITLGSPIAGGPKYTVFAKGYRKQGLDIDALADKADAREARPLPCPVTAIYTRGDGIVAWGSCIDTQHDHVEHLETTATHFGLPFHPQTLRLIAEALARHPVA